MPTLDTIAASMVELGELEGSDPREVGYLIDKVLQAVFAYDLAHEVWQTMQELYDEERRDEEIVDEVHELIDPVADYKMFLHNTQIAVPDKVYLRTLLNDLIDQFEPTVKEGD